MMTLEEAIERIGEQYKVCKEFYHLSANPEKDYPGVMSYMEALDMALTALRPVSREQVEKVWRGEWIVQHGDLSGFIKKCSKCGFLMSVWLGPDKFCANCGAPMTDEAVDMVIERINEMEGTGNGLG